MRDEELRRGVQSVGGAVTGQNIQVGGDFHGSINIATAQELSWPVHVGTPPRAADCYQVRHDLDESMNGPDGLLGATAVLVGMGGVGKTQIAARIARQARDNGTDLVVWISANSRDAVLESYAETANRLHIVLPGTSLEAAASALANWLACTGRRWLIVLDDVSDPANMRGLWPQVTAVGQVIVTTRRRESAIVKDDVRLIPLDVYTSDQADSYLGAKLANHPDLLMGVEELGRELGRLPLALAQSAAYIIDRNITCLAYIERFRNKRTQLGKLFPDDSGLPDDHEVTVAASWSVSIELANKLPPVGLARPLLEIASVFAPSEIPIEVLTSEPVATSLGEDLGCVVRATEIEDAIRCLVRLSLVTQSDRRSVVIHSLVQRSVRDLIVGERWGPLCLSAADALALAWPDVEQSSTFVASLRANATSLIDCAGVQLWDGRCHSLLSYVGESLGYAGLVTEARTHYQRLLESVTEHLGPDHPDVLTLRNNEATWCGEAGDVSGAIERFHCLLADQERVVGRDDPTTLSCRNNLAHWRGRSGDLRGAIAEFELLLTDQTRILGTDHRNTFITRSNLASLRSELGDTVSAVDELKKLLVDRTHALGPDHPDTMTTRSNLASLYGDAGYVKKSVAELERLLVDCTRVMGSDHPDTLAIRNNLAAWHGYSGNVNGAVAEFERLLGALLAKLGPEHPNTLTTRANLSYWRSEAGDTVGAVSELVEVLGIRLRVQGPLHPATLGTRHDLAHARWYEGNMVGALRELESVLSDRESVLGVDHPDTLSTRNSIAGLRGELGDVAGAVADLQLLLADRERVLGRDHPDTLATRNNLAGYRSYVGDLDSTLREFEVLYNAQVRLLGPDHPQTVASRANLASVLAAAGDGERAMQELDRLLADQLRVLGPRHPDVLATWLELQELRQSNEE
jgi:hypothetical protein